MVDFDALSTMSFTWFEAGLQFVASDGHFSQLIANQLLFNTSELPNEQRQYLFQGPVLVKQFEITLPIS